MPHQCTDCGRAFDDGSTEMLSGCPDCGGTTFQFHPSDSDVPDEPEPAESPEPPGPEGSVARTVGNAATTVKDLVGSDRGPADTELDPAPVGDAEDAAQASARSELVSPDELAVSAETTRPTPVVDERSERGPDGDRPDLADLRAELNEQFESIKVVEPGQYELNLMSLYDREEYIIALQEDGKYTIQVPERWSDEN
jgi:predicted  nucleic acid-binding Zn-ribbon protein